MLLHDDVVYQILRWLPVMSFIRFKLVCKTWRALIESNYFVKQHLHHHHHSRNLRDKNRNLIHMVDCKDSPFTFPLLSIDCIEEPKASVQLDFSDLREYFPLQVLHVVSYNGIVCLSLRNSKRKYSICLWNPATKQSRFLPQSPSFTLERERSFLGTMLGFGFDVKNNDYKVVNLCRNEYDNKEIVDRVDVYSFSADSWTSAPTVFPVRVWLGNARRPFNNGTCFFWVAWNDEVVAWNDEGVAWNEGDEMILCFDFNIEKFRSISFPNDSSNAIKHYAIVVNDKIADVSHRFDGKIEIWVFNEYGSVNESWVKLYAIDPFPTIDRTMSVNLVSIYGNYIFFKATNCSNTIMVCVCDMVTKEVKNLSTLNICKETDYKEYGYYDLTTSRSNLVDFKESLLSVRKDNNEWIKEMTNN